MTMLTNFLTHYLTFSKDSRNDYYNRIFVRSGVILIPCGSHEVSFLLSFFKTQIYHLVRSRQSGIPLFEVFG